MFDEERPAKSMNIAGFMAAAFSLAMAPLQLVAVKDLLIGGKGAWIEFGPLNLSAIVLCLCAGLLFVGVGGWLWRAPWRLLWPEMLILSLALYLNSGVLLGRSLQAGGGYFLLGTDFWLVITGGALHLIGLPVWIAARALSGFIPAMNILSYTSSIRTEAEKSSAEWGRNLILLLAVMLLIMLSSEVISRSVAGLTVFETQNYLSQTAPVTDNFENIHDDTIGWTYPRDARSNPLGLIPTTDGKIPDWTMGDADVLVVGDSFAAGPPESNWPNQLAAMSGRKVINGAVGGYGLGQIYLRAQQLVPIMKPSLLLISFIPDDLRRAELDIFQGHAKPVFHVRGGDMKLDISAVQNTFGYAQNTPMIGYSHLMSRIFEMFELDSSQTDRRVHKQGQELGCLLMSRFASLAQDHGSEVIIIVQLSAHDITARARDVRALAMASHTVECARASGLRVIDSLAKLRPLPLGSDVNLGPILRRYWRYPDDPHMSAEGDALVAKTIFSAVFKSTSTYAF